jgi:hypothetical protein
MFHAEYSSGQPLCILVDLRTAVEAALAQSAKAAGTQTQPKAMAAAAAAVAHGAAPEFEVAASPSTWDGDASG